jgi:4-diphosphocytidyl-2-C-methyl-D-erythritol kinase
LDQGAALSVTAPAKVNLDLFVTGRRADGYHLLDSTVIFADIADRLTLAPAPSAQRRLVARGPFAAALPADADRNLAMRALDALASALGQLDAGWTLVLDKHLPAAAGLGGGSADAAAALRLGLALWGGAAQPPDMAALALGLGADVPVCLAGAACRMTGVGEGLQPLPPLPPAWLVLANPGVALETAPVFRARTGPFSDPPPPLPLDIADAAGLAQALARRRNDLTQAALSLAPSIGALLGALQAAPGCLLARMSGSGASCFGLFATEGQAREALPALRARGWWAEAGAILPAAPSIVRTQAGGAA